MGSVLSIFIIVCYLALFPTEVGGLQENQDKSRGAPGNKIRVLFVGDTSFAEAYQQMLVRDGKENYVKTRGYEYSMEHLGTLTKSADFVVANLETTLTTSNESPFTKSKRYLHRDNVILTPSMLREHKIGAVSLANNHSLDYGPLALLQTFRVLRKNNIASFGAGPTEKHAATPFEREFSVGSKTFQLIVASGFAYRKDYERRFEHYAKENSSGVNSWTSERAYEQIRSIRKAKPKAFIIAFPHWGANYLWKTKNQTRIGHALIEAGADLVLGHGAHMLQEIERLKNRWIVYSLGNFMFYSPGRYQKRKVPPFSLAAMLEISENQKPELRIYPIVSDNLRTDYQPRPATEEEFKEVLKLLLDHSENKELLHTSLKTGKDSLGYFLIPVL